MLKKLFVKSLAISIDGNERQFGSPKELDGMLSERVRLSPRYTATLIDYRDEALLRQLERFTQQERYFSGLLSRLEAAVKDSPPEDPDTTVVSQDNDWRDIFSAVGQLGPEYLDYRRVLLQRYIEYLRSSQELVQTIYANRQRKGRPPVQEEEWGIPGAPISYPRQVLTFDPDTLVPQSQRNTEYRRLIKDKAVSFRLGPHQSITLKLDKYRFLVVQGEPWLLIDENGDDYRLHLGKNLIGRSSICDVVIDSSYQTISRTHFTLDIPGAGEMQLTDTSSRGTFLPAQEPFPSSAV